MEDYLLKNKLPPLLDYSMLRKLTVPPLTALRFLSRTWSTVICSSFQIRAADTHLLNQSIIQSINQAITQSINKPINQQTNQSIYQSINQSINQQTNHSINVCLVNVPSCPEGVSPLRVFSMSWTSLLNPSIGAPCTVIISFIHPSIQVYKLLPV